MFCREGTDEGVPVGGGGRGLNCFALRKRGEERGDEVGLVLVRLAIEAWRFDRDEAGEIDGFTAVAFALIGAATVSLGCAAFEQWKRV